MEPYDDTKAHLYRQLALGLAAAQVIAGFLLAKKAYDEYKKSTDALEALNIVREEMAVRIHEHRLTVTFPFQKYAMDTALGIVVPSPNYGGLCNFFSWIASSDLYAARKASRTYLEHFCEKPSTCERALDYAAGVAIVDATYARARYQERMEERIRQLRIDTIQTVHAGTFTSPSGVFGLIDSAASIYGYIQNQAFSNLGGAVSTFSYGLAGIMNSFGSGKS